MPFPDFSASPQRKPVALEKLRTNQPGRYDMQKLKAISKADLRKDFTPGLDGYLQEPIPPLVSLVIPAFNEAAILEHNLGILCDYMKTLENEYRWELLLVNDGSKDATGAIAEAFARTKNNIRVIHHVNNFGMGQALQTGFNHSKGHCVVTLDIDLSYATEHIGQLLRKIHESKAKVVVASPYMRGGSISNVPLLRRALSRWANHFLAIAAKGHLSTLTGVVRAYDGDFVRRLNLKATGMEINPEVIYKASLLRARVEEIPAHLDWQMQRTETAARRSSMKVLRQTLSILLSGFTFRPVIFFVLPGIVLLLFSAYVNSWMFTHFFRHYSKLDNYHVFLERCSAAVAAAYSQSPHTFLLGGLSLMMAIQLISLGILALQSKGYFEEIFHLGSTIHKNILNQGRSKHE
jgi:glycosyltransferase involved in cell wall biosynthesis